ncbi:MAG: hypothetical protein WBB28_25870 [Crinalium sp.]
MRTSSAYAPPVVWGPKTPVYQRIRLDDYPQTVRITYNALGSTDVFGEVFYYSPEGFRHETLFSGMTITLGSGLGRWVEMRFKTGITGTFVEVQVDD